MLNIELPSHSLEKLLLTVICSNVECDSVPFLKNNFYLMKGNMHATTHMWQAENSLGGTGSPSTIRLPGIELKTSCLAANAFIG